ncbi:hypothetical protein [Halapricum desulfuricans]|uniref:Uncharacterized protein n=2 Tax=Halapricum desulfuricans TaxID=2841257 RepID=A0A897N4V3_9EURY|nr:hypothetical protein [Halapricum desulfuricans]QSG07767.1 Uncharacterized protein HSR122_0356 [Halapricum desulfuricans]QSG16039.1 Uncharacterized protein HSEST_2529 [Halapricum desulfuricans]
MTSDIDGDEQRSEPVDWESVPPDPDLEDDLGYELGDMDVIETNNGSGQILLLPPDEESIRDQSFIVSQESLLVNLIDNC